MYIELPLKFYTVILPTFAYYKILAGNRRSSDIIKAVVFDPDDQREREGGIGN